MSRRKVEKHLDAFGSANDAESMANELYGGGEAASELQSNRVVARGIDVLSIRPDLRQPRRAVPVGVRGDWLGDPAELQGLFERWAQMVRSSSGLVIDLAQMILSTNQTTEVDAERDTMTAGLLGLVSLAGDIHREGLTNPITVVRRGDQYMVETGERRWLAFNLLRLYVDAERYKAIPARVMDRFSVWRQASENTKRSELNAIGKARQLALLIMELYEGVDGVRFEAYEHVMKHATSDQYYYAQVANGNVYKIPQGMAQKIQEAMGFTSYSHVSNYRRLLKIDKDLWIQADMGNWTENAIRVEQQSRDAAQNEQNTFTPVKVPGDDRRFEPVTPPVPGRSLSAYYDDDQPRYLEPDEVDDVVWNDEPPALSGKTMPETQTRREIAGDKVPYPQESRGPVLADPGFETAADIVAALTKLSQKYGAGNLRDVLAWYAQVTRDQIRDAKPADLARRLEASERVLLQFYEWQWSQVQKHLARLMEINSDE